MRPLFENMYVRILFLTHLAHVANLEKSTRVRSFRLLGERIKFRDQSTLVKHWREQGKRDEGWSPKGKYPFRRKPFSCDLCDPGVTYVTLA
jgi:hypothetical protein